MRKWRKYFIPSLFILLWLINSGLVTNSAFAYKKPAIHAPAIPVSPGKRVSATDRVHHVVNMKKVPQSKGHIAGRQTFPDHTGIDPRLMEKLLQAARHNPHAPISSHSYPAPKQRNGIKAQTPIATPSFQGLSQNGFEPPDQALAASPEWVFQGVNLQFAVYDTGGTLQSGWPKNTADFFGVPSPGACSSTPFMSDPRAFYDVTDNRFWAAALEVEGVDNTCPFKSLYWIAVSQTNNPNGIWNVYSFDMALGSNNWADYTQFGFNGQAIYFSGNMFNTSKIFQYSEVFSALKAPMEAGTTVNYFGFINQTVGGVSVDTVQPVEAIESGNGGPGAGIFVNSFNFNFGGGDCSNGCNGLTIWTMTNPGQPNADMTGVVVSTSTYTLAPRADQPGCTACVPEKAPPDTRISGTPVYSNGLVSFALTTGVNNGTQIVPGIFWGQVSPVFNTDGSIATATIFQSGYFNYSGDGAATYPALMTDDAGNLFMVFEFMNSSTSPSVAYAARPVSFTLGAFPDGGFFLRQGDAATNGTRWGDYEAASYSSCSGSVWLAGEYSTADGTWSTFIGADKFDWSTSNWCK
jgi:hypothetical protein